MHGYFTSPYLPSRAPQRGGLRTLDGHDLRNALLCPKWRNDALGIKTHCDANKNPRNIQTPHQAPQ